MKGWRYVTFINGKSSHDPRPHPDVSMLYLRAAGGGMGWEVLLDLPSLFVRYHAKGKSLQIFIEDGLVR